MLLKSLSTKDGRKVKLTKFNVLVGPNNAGKSEALRDIYKNLLSQQGRVLVQDVEYETPTFDDLLAGLEVFDDPNTEGHKIIRGLKSDLQVTSDIRIPNQQIDIARKEVVKRKQLKMTLAEIRVAYLHPSTRLQVASAKDSFDQNEQAPDNPLQELYAKGLNAERHLREGFKSAFGIEIQLDISGQRTHRFRIAEEFPQIPSDPREASKVMNEFRHLDNQGDGFKCFVGVVLSLLASQGRVVLLDEPEMFLHPAQARQLGRWIAEHSKRYPSQIVVATHNAHFLAGILSATEDVSIIRLNRARDATSFNLMSSDATDLLVNSPVLSSQRVIEAIFHVGVVVCEGDADRLVYNCVASEMIGMGDVLFIHAHNKQTIWKVVELLRNAKIPVCGVTDIDILNSKGELQRLYSALNGMNDWEGVESTRAEIADAIDRTSEDERLATVLHDVEDFVTQLQRKEHDLSGARGALNRLRSNASTWSSIKKGGIEAIPDAVQEKVRSLLTKLEGMGLFIVNVGELESWINLDTRQKNIWIVRALEKLSSGGCPGALRAFVARMLSFLGVGK